MKSKLTTGAGDGGETRALSGKYCSKGHPIMECVGTLDELRAHLALARRRLLEERGDTHRDVARLLLWVMHALFPLGALFSDPQLRKPALHRVTLTPGHLARLEREQLALEARTPLPRAFIVEASNSLAAQVDLACTVARRLERQAVRLADVEPALREGVALPFLNRLSDCLFMVARSLENGAHQTVDYDLLAGEAPPDPGAPQT